MWRRVRAGRAARMPSLALGLLALCPKVIPAGRSKTLVWQLTAEGPPWEGSALRSEKSVVFCSLLWFE